MNKIDFNQPALPIQPVEKPILCSPYIEPHEHWFYDSVSGAAERVPGRRPASYWYKDPEARQGTASLFAEEQRDDLRLVNCLRDDVKRWRNSKWEGAENVTKELLRHWWREDRLRRLFFCQLEAVETIIYLTEIRGQSADGSRRKPRFIPQFVDADFGSLIDIPNEADSLPLTRYGCKMATGSGKTVVMAMLIAWAFCNRGQAPSDERFPCATLVCCPNLTVKERLQVLRPDDPNNYYAAFDIVPARLRPLMASGKVLITNWHAFAPESEHAEGGKSYAVVNKGLESPDAFARRILGDLYDNAPLMVLNDEAHHAYRPAPLTEKLIGEEAQAAKQEREEATVWVSGLDRINLGCGVRFCVDLSATPFYLQGSGFPEGSPLGWLVSDFGLVDAIESGIVKIPRLPVSDTTGRPEPKYFRLWRNIVDNMAPGDRLPGRARKPKPTALWTQAQPALSTLASQWIERYNLIQTAQEGQEKTPPVLILVCDNTSIAEHFYEQISGERQVEAIEIEADEEGEEGEEDGGEDEQPATRTTKRKMVTKYGTGQLFPEYFSNRENFRPTLRIDTKMLNQAESEEPNVKKQDAAEQLRRIIATVGKIGEPGEQVRCVVSVAMLTEGWDANNVTHILGLRAFGSQLLCEQVVGRGLRRMDYTVDPETGLLTEEYVDVYGIPFSVIPYKGRPTDKPAPEDKPKNHVRALPERAALEIRFPVVEGFTYDLQGNQIQCDISQMLRLDLEPNTEPTALYVKPTVGYQQGHLHGGPGEFTMQTREQFYASTHLQAIEFEMARQVVEVLLGASSYTPGLKASARMGLQARHQLFPQVLRYVHQYVTQRVDFKAQHKCELGLDKYIKQVVERLVMAIQPIDQEGEPALLPILNRYKPFGTTAEVDFKTTRRCGSAFKSHINQVVFDNEAWEAIALFQLEASPHVICFVKNAQMGFVIPYEHLNQPHSYEPDYLVRLADGRILILEIKGYEDNQTQAKHQGAQRWISAVNHCDKLGKWTFHVCKNPQALGNELAYLAASPP